MHKISHFEKTGIKVYITKKMLDTVIVNLNIIPKVLGKLCVCTLARHVQQFECGGILDVLV